MTARDLLDLALRHYGPGLWLLLAVAVAELANLLSLRRLNAFGIVPREAAGLPGILLGPLLHHDLRHFAGNLLPLFVLGFLLGRLLPGQFWAVTGAITAGTGLAVWLLFFFTLRYVSLASMMAGVGVVATMVAQMARSGAWDGVLLTFGLLVMLLVILRHRANIGRILAGTEPRAGRKRG